MGSIVNGGDGQLIRGVDFGIKVTMEDMVPRPPE